MTLATIMHLPSDQFFSLYGAWAVGVVFVIATFVGLQIRERTRH
ncbi:MAG: hypothetical protein R3B09_14480 [Nannocystaceae bacterium]